MRTKPLYRLAAVAALCGAGLAAPAAAQTCEPTPTMHAVRILGTGRDGALTDLERPYVAGERSFFQELDNGWVFALMRAEAGWSIRLYENAAIGDAVDLTSMTPPFGGAPNPRDVFGWHFRNADNTGPNTGDVNAPQQMRAFVVSPALAGTGGFRPSTNADEPRLREPGPDDAIGWLSVLDYGLANTAAGAQARMNYLEFDACVSWPRSEEDQARLEDLASPEYTDEDREMFGACGLDLAALELNARYLPRTLGGDIDGDGALDNVAQVRRTTDDKRGLALCRAGTWLHEIGLDGAAVGDLEPGYVDQVEAWQWITPGGERPRHLTGYDLPEADGDVLVLERIEKEAVAVYWRDGALQARRLYRHVEP